MTSPLPPDSSKPTQNAGKDKSNKTDGLFNRLAQRSTGLEKDVTPVDKDAGKNGADPLWRLGGIGVQMAGTVAIAAIVGRWLDHREGWGYAATLTLSSVALIGSFYLLIRAANNMSK